MNERIKDESMNEVQQVHFTQTRKLIAKYKGREIKTIGDSFMVVFRSVEKALDFARTLQSNTGNAHVQIRAGIHIGSMQVTENDVFGETVNFASRVLGLITEAEIWISERAREDIDRFGADHHRCFNWKRHDGMKLKGFAGEFTLWSIE